MPIIYSYPPTTFLSDDDTFVITKTIEEENTIETRSVSFEDLKKSIISKLAGGTPNYIPVFNTSNTIIDSSMYLDDFAAPTLLTIGNDTKIQGNLTLEQDQADTTLTLVSDGSNSTPGGEQHNPSIKFIQDGGAQNAAVGFNIIDDTGAGTIPGTGNRFWIVNAMDDNVGEGGITFGTAQIDGWDNAIGRFIIRGDGKGLFGHPDSLYNKTLGSQFEIYDNRDENTTTDPSFSVYSVVDYAAPSGNEGAGGIKQILDVYNNGVFEGQESMMLIPGTNSSDFAASTPIAFFTNSDMDTQSPSGFAGMIFDSGNWLLDGSGTFTATDPGYQLTVDGDQWLKGALHDVNESLGAAGQVLSSTGTGVEWISGGIGGGGTLDTIAMFTPDGTTIGDSDIIKTAPNTYQINNSLTVGTNLTTTNLFADNISAANAGNVNLNGNVGIGTTSPATKLQIGSGSADDAARVYFSDGSYTEMRGYGLQFNRTTSYIRPTADNTSSLNIGSLSATWNTLIIDATTTIFKLNANEKMRINSSGNVGIGTSSPSHKLDVDGYIAADRYVDTDNASFYLEPGSGLGLVHATGQWKAQTPSGYVSIGPNNSSYCHFYTDRGQYYFDKKIVVDTGVIASYNEDLTFQAPTNSTRMVIDSSTGNVGIGTTNPGVYRLNVAGIVNFQTSSTVPGFDVVNITGGAVQRNTQADDSNSSTGSECLRLKHAGVDDGNFGLMITFRDSSGNIKGKISSTSTSTTYATSSDQRLKEDPKDFDALNLISQIQPYDFKWKTSGERDFGFYAQELNEVLPQAVDVPTLDDGVTIDEDAMLMADYTKLVPVLVKAIQQLKDKIQTLENQ